MKAKIKAWWPTVAHAAAVAVIFLDPSVQAAAASHPKTAGAIGLVWGIVLAWARSPHAPAPVPPAGA